MKRALALALLFFAVESKADWTCGGLCIYVYERSSSVTLVWPMKQVATTGATQAEAFRRAIDDCGSGSIYVLGTASIADGGSAAVGRILTLNEACAKN